jgi:hypothetical protein
MLRVNENAVLRRTVNLKEREGVIFPLLLDLALYYVNYYPQYSVVRHIQPVFFSQGEMPSFAPL